jgi:diacylglycerol kinase (ATP)
LIQSFNYAISGVVYAFRTQRNMKIHFGVAIMVLAISLFMDFSRVELLILFFTISLVMITEMINTSIEASIDIMTREYNQLAKIAKNVAAGAVLISAINAVVVAYLLFFDRLYPFTYILLWRVRQSPVHITFISLLLVVLVVIIAKSVTGKETSLQGGMPSGHSAVAFSAVAAIAFISEDMLVTTLTLLLAILVVQSRIEAGIHNTYEVVIGAVLGIIITVLIFQLI